ncbi:MAG: hypothetical protein WCD60_07270 [Pseudolabrys sp.]
MKRDVVDLVWEALRLRRLNRTSSPHRVEGLTYLHEIVVATSARR